MATEKRDVKLGTVEMAISQPYVNRKGESRIGLSGRTKLFGVEAVISVTMPANAKIPNTGAESVTSVADAEAKAGKAKGGLTSNTKGA